MELFNNPHHSLLNTRVMFYFDHRIGLLLSLLSQVQKIYSLYISLIASLKAFSVNSENLLVRVDCRKNTLLLFLYF